MFGRDAPVAALALAGAAHAYQARFVHCRALPEHFCDRMIDTLRTFLSVRPEANRFRRCRCDDHF
jgi:hypothetical protein